MADTKYYASRKSKLRYRAANGTVEISARDCRDWWATLTGKDDMELMIRRGQIVETGPDFVIPKGEEE